jgi:hypothetical protein
MSLVKYCFSDHSVGIPWWHCVFVSSLESHSQHTPTLPHKDTFAPNNSIDDRNDLHSILGAIQEYMAKDLITNTIAHPPGLKSTWFEILQGKRST